MTIDGKKNPPKISIIIPAYNSEKYLEKCIHSILSSSFNDIEILLINDGSHNKEEIDRYETEDNRVKVIHRQHEGVSAARNEGLRLALAPYVSFVDSDDFIHPQMYATLYKLINEQNADIVSCNANELSENTIINQTNIELDDMSKPNLIIMDGCDAVKHFLLSNHITSSTVWGKLYDKKLFEDVRFPKRKVSGDAAVAFKLYIKSKRVVHINAPFYNYVIRKNSITNSGFSKSNMEKLDTSDEILAFSNKNNHDLVDYATSFHIVTAIRLAAYFDKKTIMRYPNEYKKIKDILLSKKKNTTLLAPRHKILLFLFKYSKPLFRAVWKHRLKYQ